MTVDELASVAQHEFSINRYNERSKFEFTIPYVESHDTVAGPVKYATYGDPGVRNLVFVSMPYGNDVDATNMQMRLRAQQDTLREDEYCVIGVQEVSPSQLPIPPEYKKSLRQGGLRVFGHRLLGLVEKFAPTDDQEITFYGFSLGADVTTEAVDEAVYSEQGSNYPVHRMGVFDPARSEQRSALRLLRDFGDSGPDLFDRIVDSKSLALNDWYRINTYTLNSEEDWDKQKKQFDKAIASQVVKESLRSPIGNIVMLKALANMNTFTQLSRIVNDIPPNVLSVTVGRAERSTVTPESFIEHFENLPVRTVRVNGTHAIADSLPYSAAMLGKTLGF